MMKKEKYIAFNTHLFLALFVFIVFVAISICCAIERKIGPSIGFAIATALPIFFILISPVYVIFSDRDIKIIYMLGQKEVIKWCEIRDISLHGSWFRRAWGGGFPHYIIAYYSTVKKRAFFVKGEIPKTRRIKKLIKHYYKKKII